MGISATQVRELRERTGAGMMDCKKALQESDGDMEKAIEGLRKKGLSQAAKRSGRIAAEGTVTSYIHAGGKIGVLLEVNCETDFVGRGDDFQTFSRDIAMHVAAASPRWINREEVPAEEVAREKDIYAEQVRAEGKPENVIEKIVEGKLNKKFFAETCLLDQTFVKDTDKTVQDIVNDLIAKTGEKISIRRFVRFELGEGMEKRSHDLAAEVQAELDKFKS
jgi:elongation factor Ts